MHATFSAPAPGSYTGKVNGHHTLINVTSDAVFLVWREPRLGCIGNFSTQQNAWDIIDGRFTPMGVSSFSIKRNSRLDG